MLHSTSQRTLERSRSPSARDLLKQSNILETCLFEQHLNDPCSEKWIEELHRRSKTHGCVDSVALERAWAESSDTPAPNRISRQMAITYLTEAFEKLGLRDEWLAHAISLFDRARALMAADATGLHLSWSTTVLTNGGT